METDRHPAAAASRFFVHNSSAELVEGLLIHDDRELLAEAIAVGDAIKGEIIEVWDEAATLADGSFGFDSVPRGRYVLVVDAPAYSLLSRRLTVRQGRGPDVDLTLQEAAPLEGRVLEPGGGGAVGIEVVFREPLPGLKRL